MVVVAVCVFFVMRCWLLLFAGDVIVRCLFSITRWCLLCAVCVVCCCGVCLLFVDVVVCADGCYRLHTNCRVMLVVVCCML